MTLPAPPAPFTAFTAGLSFLVALASTSPVSAATAEDRAAAAQHLKQAQELRKQGQLAEACDQLQEVERLDPKVPTSLELADCTEQLGKLVEAQALWSVARDRARQAEKPQSRMKAEERLAAVEKRIAHLTLQLDAAAAGAEVLRDGVVVEPASLGNAQALNPGDHAIIVKLSGHDDASYDVKLAEGETRTLPLAPGPAIVTAPPPPPPRPVAPPPKPVEVSSSGSGQRTLGVILGATGLVSAGIGVPLWAIGYRDGGGGGLGGSADQQLLAGQILTIGGGVLLVTGVVLFATAPSGKSSTDARAPLVPLVAIGPNGTVLGATGSF
jgi:hypothetical protein